MEQANNSAELTGTLGARPEYSHTGRDRDYYVFPLEVERLSGAVDTVNVIVRREMLAQLEVDEYPRLRVRGELRSFNNKSGKGNKLVITVFAREMELTDDGDENRIMLTGTLCRKPTFRTTPMGREICDMMLAVNRKYGRSDYLPCIAWGRNAEKAAGLDVGDSLSLSGRIQSRKYLKAEESGTTEKTAYEVSVTELESQKAEGGDLQ